jgi:O-antigen/teichoic acid export membrane protein
MSLLRKAILAGGGSVVCTGLGVATNMILARSLLPEGMGRYQLPLTASTLAITILSLGVGQSNIYFLNKHKIEPRQIVKNSVFFGFSTAIILMILLPLSLTTFENYFGVLHIWIKILFSFGIVSLFCSELFKPILIAGLQVRESVQPQIVNAAVFLLIVFICFIFKLLSVNVTLIALTVGNITSLAMVIYFLRDRIDFSISFAWPVFIQVLRYGLQLLASNLVYVLNASVGLMLLRYLMPESFAIVGLYGRAVALCGLITLIPYAAGPILYSRWSELSGDARKSQVELAMRLHLALGFLIVLFMVFFADWCMLFLYGKEFLAAVPSLRILVIGIALRCAFSVCNNLLASDGKAYITAYIMGTSVVAIVGLTWLLVPHYGMNGAALADMIAGILVFGMGLFLLNRSYGFSLKKMLLFRADDFRYILNAVRNRGITSRDGSLVDDK